MNAQLPVARCRLTQLLPLAAARLNGVLRLLGGTALLVGLALLFAGPEALRDVAQLYLSLLSV